MVRGLRRPRGGQAARSRRALLRELTQQAFADPLTGLGNRRALTRRLDDLAAHAHVSVLTLDLDGFKEVNDVLGHARGDALLGRRGGRRAGRSAARRRGASGSAATSSPSSSQGPPDGRTRGRAAAGLRPAGGRHRARRRRGAGLGQRRRRRASTTTCSPAWSRAALALRAAKAAGRDRVELYDGPIAARHRRALLVERRLREAVAAGDVVPHYQPVVDLRTRRVVGVEALARWDDPVLGPVTPDEFIPVAERSGLIAAVGAQVLARTVHDLAALARARPDLGRCAPASTPRSPRCAGADYAETVLGRCSSARACPQGSLIVEVTESLFVDVDDPALRELRALRAGGVHVAIDDFGSGYSSLAYLSRMPANILKIDRALTAQVLHDPRSLAVPALGRLARGQPADGRGRRGRRDRAGARARGAGRCVVRPGLALRRRRPDRRARRRHRRDQRPGAAPGAAVGVRAGYRVGHAARQPGRSTAPTEARTRAPTRASRTPRSSARSVTPTSSERLRDLPPGLRLGPWDLPGRPDPDIEVVVPPYIGGRPTAPLAELPNLRLVQTLTAGYEDVLPHLPDGVALANAVGVHDASTGELAVGLAIAALRGFPAVVRSQAAGRWAPTFGSSLADRRVLLIGYGGVGQAVERRLLAASRSTSRLRRPRGPGDGVHGIDELPALLPDTTSWC